VSGVQDVVVLDLTVEKFAEELRAASPSDEPLVAGSSGAELPTHSAKAEQGVSGSPEIP
jgi:hypothetical protein